MTSGLRSELVYRQRVDKPATESLAALHEVLEHQDPGERARGLTQLLEVAQTRREVLSRHRDEAVRRMRGAGATNATIARTLGISASRARQLGTHEPERRAPYGTA